MTQAVETPVNVVCPRCRSTTTGVLSTAPVAQAWTIFGCNACFYTWRSTEPGENTDPDKYPVVFRLRTEDVKAAPVAPTVPPRRPAGPEGTSGR
jgi:hypothetical protein